MGSTLLPDYAGGGLVNLMQSIATACGSNERRYPPLAVLGAASGLASARNIVLLLVDGLGLRMLTRHRGSPQLQRHLLGSMTSVFPSTTASAITTVMSGLAPTQHGLTGWHMHLDEVDQTLAILPLTPRQDAPRLPPEQLPPQLFSHASLFETLTRECWVVAPRSIAASPFNAWHSRGARVAAYATLPELYSCLTEILLDSASPRYIYAYYPELDSLAHHHGCDSRPVQRALADLDAGFAELLRVLRGSDSWLLVTADHGFIDSPARRVISLDDHPRLAALLQRPLCGERRVAYCYVAENDRPAFEAYIRRHLSRAVHLSASEHLVAAGWFGPPPWHPRLHSRIGDYTLLMKDDWTIKDWLPGERRFAMLGVHGGISASEMRIPLVAAHA
jgi:predicted AlkP superfamily pyrophosphatase or phosphodiesterase